MNLEHKNLSPSMFKAIVIQYYNMLCVTDWLHSFQCFKVVRMCDPRQDLCYIMMKVIFLGEHKVNKRCLGQNFMSLMCYLSGIQMSTRASLALLKFSPPYQLPSEVKVDDICRVPNEFYCCLTVFTSRKVDPSATK